MTILLINKFLYPKGGSPLANLAEGGDAIVTLSTGELLRAHRHEAIPVKPAMP